MSACESKGAWQEGLTSWKLLRQETKGLKNTSGVLNFAQIMSVPVYILLMVQKSCTS